MAEFSKERLYSVMQEQGIKDLDELKDLMGYDENLNLSRYLTNNIPLNLLNGICNVLNVSRDYLMMEDDEVNIKPLIIQPVPVKKERDYSNVGRKPKWMLEPNKYEKCNIDTDRLQRTVMGSDISLSIINEFIDDNIYSILNGSLTSIKKSTMHNLSWLLQQDKYYIMGTNPAVNKFKISYQTYLDKEIYTLNKYFFRNLSEDDIIEIAAESHVPKHILWTARIKNVRVTEKVSNILEKVISDITGDPNPDIVYTPSGVMKPDEDDSAPIQEEEITEEVNLKDIIKLVDKLPDEDIRKLYEYCNAKYAYNKVLETIN